jgi:hypothetical protein
MGRDAPESQADIRRMFAIDELARHLHRLCDFSDQARHYNRHDHMPEKRDALALWVPRFGNLPPEPRRTTARAKDTRVGERAAVEQAVLAGQTPSHQAN